VETQGLLPTHHSAELPKQPQPRIELGLERELFPRAALQRLARRRHTPPGRGGGGGPGGGGGGGGGAGAMCSHSLDEGAQLLLGDGLEPVPGPPCTRTRTLTGCRLWASGA
jgi:hypothetical protein